MKLVIPLPWYSPKVYSICDDEFRGGWRAVFMHLRIRRRHICGPAAGFTLEFSIGIGTRFDARQVRNGA